MVVDEDDSFSDQMTAIAGNANMFSCVGIIENSKTALLNYTIKYMVTIATN